MTDADLTGASFMKADLRGTKWKNDEDSVSLQGMNFTSADFTGSRLWNTNFEDAILNNAKMDNADLTGSNFKNADLRNAQFIYTKITNANFLGASGWIPGENYHADLTGDKPDMEFTFPEEQNELVNQILARDF